MASYTSPAEDIATMLQTGSIGTIGATSGWAITVSKFEATPDTHISLTNVSGGNPDPKWLLDFGIVNIKVRGAVFAYQAMMSKSLDVRNLLLGKAETTVNTTVYKGIWMVGDILEMGYDDNNRPITSMNFRVAAEPTTGGRTAL